MRAQLEFRAPPLGAGTILVFDRLAADRICVGKVAVVRVASVVGPDVQVQFVPQVTLVLHVDEALGVDRIGSWVEELGAGRVAGGGGSLLAGRVRGLHAQAFVRVFRERTLVLVVVDAGSRALGHSGIGGARKMQVLAPALIAGGRQQQFGPAFELPAVGHPALAGSEVANLDRGLCAAQRLGGLGDHVDHAEEGVAAVDGRAGPGHELDAVDQIHVEQEIGTQRRRVVDAVVRAVAVDQQQHSRVVIARSSESGHAYVRIDAVIANVQSADAAQDVGQGSIPVRLDVGRGDDGHGGRRFAALLRKT